jgi:hypothetical protein
VIVVRCRRCGHAAKIATPAIGQRLRCGQCGAVFVYDPPSRRSWWRYRPKPKRKPITLKQRTFDFDATG